MMPCVLWHCRHVRILATAEYNDMFAIFDRLVENVSFSGKITN